MDSDESPPRPSQHPYLALEDKDASPCQEASHPVTKLSIVERIMADCSENEEVEVCTPYVSVCERYIRCG